MTTKPKHRGIGAGLFALRTARGLTMREVASIAGICKSAVCHLERGIRDPQFSTLRGLARAFNLTTPKLVEHLEPYL